MLDLPTDNARKSEHTSGIGVVIALDCTQAPGVVKVRLDDNQVTDWIPFVSPRAGQSYVWMPPQVGEQGLVISHGGEMNLLFFVAGIFSEKTQPDDASKDLTRIQLSNGDRISHDARDGSLTIETLGKITINAPHVHVNSNITVDGRISASGDITAGTISLQHHVHPGVKSGRAKTARPI